jgi:hypothetical protein
MNINETVLVYKSCFINEILLSTKENLNVRCNCIKMYMQIVNHIRISFLEKFTAAKRKCFFLSYLLLN